MGGEMESTGKHGHPLEPRHPGRQVTAGTALRKPASLMPDSKSRMRALKEGATGGTDQHRERPDGVADAGHTIGAVGLVDLCAVGTSS